MYITVDTAKQTAGMPEYMFATGPAVSPAQRGGRFDYRRAVWIFPRGAADNKLPSPSGSCGVFPDSDPSFRRSGWICVPPAYTDGREHVEVTECKVQGGKR